MMPERKAEIGTPEWRAQLRRELLGLPDPPPPEPSRWNDEWPVEGSLAFRILPPAEQWACRQARMTRQNRQQAIDSVYERTLAERRERYNGGFHRGPGDPDWGR
ncbi:hypothetical protein [Bradyrhizobium sp. 2S1]|uniref:hypothetical protein n=1 Tax=Bradyrhizobium sp. 2S1 TaxID=1404429 RepID=UPI00140B9F08